MVLGVGVDLVAMDEFRRLCGDLGELAAWCEGVLGAAVEPFVSRTFTPAELAQACERHDAAQYLAGRFAVKEAVFKALAPRTEQGFDLRVIETLDAANGAPRVTLTGSLAPALAEAGAREVLVSITNEGAYVMAFAVAQ